MNNQGWIKIHRELLKWEWYDDVNTCRLFLHLLLTVNYTQKKWRGIVINEGEIVTSIGKLSAEAKLSIQQIRTSLDKLKSTGEATIKTTSKYSLIKLNNWSIHQQDNKQSNKLATNEQQTNNKQITTTKERNNSIREERNNISKDIQEIVNFFEKSFNQKVRVLSERRKKHIKARLKIFTVEEIKLAIENFASSPFHTGDNDRGWVADLDFVIRSDENIEKGLKINDVQLAKTNRKERNQERCILIDNLYFTERERDEILEKEAVVRDEEGYPRFIKNWLNLVSFKL